MSSKKTGCRINSMKALMEIVMNCRISFAAKHTNPAPDCKPLFSHSQKTLPIGFGVDVSQFAQKAIRFVICANPVQRLLKDTRRAPVDLLENPVALLSEADEPVAAV